jgi:hypothetical protein
MVEQLRRWSGASGFPGIATEPPEETGRRTGPLDAASATAPRKRRHPDPSGHHFTGNTTREPPGRRPRPQHGAPQGARVSREMRFPAIARWKGKPRRCATRRSVAPRHSRGKERASGVPAPSRTGAFPHVRTQPRRTAGSLVPARDGL